MLEEEEQQEEPATTGLADLASNHSAIQAPE